MGRQYPGARPCVNKALFYTLVEGGEETAVRASSTVHLEGTRLFTGWICSSDGRKIVNIRFNNRQKSVIECTKYRGLTDHKKKVP